MPDRERIMGVVQAIQATIARMKDNRKEAERRGDKDLVKSWDELIQLARNVTLEFIKRANNT